MRAAIVVILSLCGLSSIALLATTPAAAQACYNYISWDFSDGQAGPWAAGGHTIISGTLSAAQNTETVLTLAEMQSALGTVLSIPSDGVSMGLDATLAGGGAVQIIISYTDGLSTTQTYDSNGTHTLNAAAGHIMQSIAIVSHSANVYDNLVFMAPCSSGGPPTPTPWPTPQSTSVFSVTTGGPPAQSPIPLPAALPLAPLTDTIDFQAFWDAGNFSGMASVVLTFFDLQNIPQFFAIFLPFMGMVIGLRLLLRIVGRRNAAQSEDI